MCVHVCVCVCVCVCTCVCAHVCVCVREVDKPVLSLWNLVRNSTSLSLFFKRMSWIGFVLFGFATNTLKTWKASNCMFLLRSLSIVIMSFRFSGLLM